VAYDAKSITVLEGLDAVRKRPGMYIGSTGERGLHHLVYEVVDNSVDEALAGHATAITVTLMADGGVRVTDDGRGIPVDRHPVEKRPAVEVVLTTLHAGGKFDGKSYAVSGGLHGVGISVVNALSSRLDVDIKRDGFAWRQSFDGRSKPSGAARGPLEKGGATTETGTTVTFWADDTIFEEIVYSMETLSRRLQETAFLNAGLSITLRDERAEVEGGVAEERLYRYDGGLADFVAHLNATKTPSHPTVIHFSKEEEGISVDVAMQWHDGYAESVHTFANTINTTEGGTHEEGFRTALTTVVNKVALEKQWIKPATGKNKGDEKLSGEDIREGLTAIVSVKMAEPQFEGQTKTKLGNTSAKSFVQRVASDALTLWFTVNGAEGKAIVLKAQQALRARMAARTARDLQRKGLMAGGGLPGKLSDCQSTDPAECELFIVEGDSAGGCFAGDTAVATAEGKSLSFAELADDWTRGVTHFGYGTDDAGDICVVPLLEPRVTRRSVEVVEVQLDEGVPLRCTPDHLFRLRDGSYRRADELAPGDSLMPLRRRLTERGEQPGAGYEMVWANGRSRWEHTHHLADAWSLGAGAAHWSQGPVRHHADFDKRNNDPRNLVRMTHEGHIALHAAHASRTPGPLRADPDFRARKLASVRESALAQWQDPAYRALKTRQVRAQRQDPMLEVRLLQGFQDWYAGLSEAERGALLERLDDAQQTWWADDAHRAEQARRTAAWFVAHPEAREQLSRLACGQWDDADLRAWRAEQTRAWWAAEPDRRVRHGAVLRAWHVAHPEQAERQRQAISARWEGGDFRDAVQQGLSTWRTATTREEKSALIRGGKQRASLRLVADIVGRGGRTTAEVATAYDADRGRTSPRWSSLVAAFDGDAEQVLTAARNHNHRVVSVRALSERTDVYDLTVDEHHNFALESGVFVHNSAKQGREPRFQAILPIRGKILNVEKARIDKVLKNTEVQALITALGTGVHEDFDLTKLRYHKLVLMADADVDGQHIRTLLLTLLFRFMKPLIEAGHVYLAQPPLFKIKWAGSTPHEYVYSERERDAVIEAGQAAGKRLPKDDAVSRYKGLGEMDFAELRDTTMDPDRRLLLRVTLDDAATADELFSVLMGDDVESRRSFIQRNAKDVRFLDI